MPTTTKVSPPKLRSAPVRPDERRSLMRPAILSLASAVSWWICLLAAHLKGFDDPGFLSGIGLYFLPLAAILLAMTAIERSRSVPEVGRDRRWKLASAAGILGLVLGGIGPMVLIMFAVTQD
jgi:hypothetical protein